MPFGPKNAPSLFQMMMNSTVGNLLYKTCCAYLDDLIVWGSTLKEVLQRTEEIINKLQEEGLILSGLKSEFGLTKVKLLGKTVAGGKIYPGKDRMQGLKDLKHPTTVSQVRSIHGALTFYRSFVPNFARKMKPIIGLLRKEDGPVLWTSA